MTKAIRKTTILFLVTSILMTMFCCGMSLEPTSVGYSGIPDSFYDYFGPGYCPDRYNLGEKVRFQRYGCPHKIVQVTPDDFIDCNIENPISVLTDDTFLFDQLGDFYFICDRLLCYENEVKFQVRIGHYEPKSPERAAENSRAPAQNSFTAPASAPALNSPSPSQTSGSPIYFSRKFGLFRN